MKKEFMDSTDWSLITDRIHEGFCVPFLGAGVNVSSSEYKGLPLGGEVALRLVEMWMDIKGVDLKEITKVTTHDKIMQSQGFDDLTRVALQNLARVSLHVEFRDDFPRLIKYLKEIIPDKERNPSPLLETLAKLPPPAKPTDPPFQLIVTTNYDRLMEQALDNCNKDYEVIVQPIDGFDPAKKRKLNKELAQYNGIIVYKLHGTFEDEDSIIITEEDYIKFLLTVVREKSDGIPNLIKAKLVDSTLLFLGYSLEDWDFRTLFKGLIETLEPRKKRKSFAIQRYPTGFWVDFWDDKGVQIRDVDLYAFAEDLELCLGIKPNVFLQALCDEFGKGAFDLISERRESGKTWRDFAESNNSKHWAKFLRKHNIPQFAPSAEGEDAEDKSRKK